MHGVLTLPPIALSHFNVPAPYQLLRHTSLLTLFLSVLSILSILSIHQREQKLQTLRLEHPPLHNYTVCSVTRTTGRRVFSDYIVYSLTHCLSTVVLSLKSICRHSHYFSLTSIHNDLRRRPLPPCHLPWLLRHDDDCPIPLPRCQFQ